MLICYIGYSERRLLYLTYMIIISYTFIKVKCLKSNIYKVFRAQADWTLTYTSHKDTEQSTVEASITLYGVTLTDSLNM
jgi:hypothetical protein